MPQIQIEQIRYELTWRIRHAAMYPELDFNVVKLENDSDGMHFGLYADDYLKSVISIFNEGSVYQFRKFATLPPVQGQGYGTLLLEHIIDYVRQQGTTLLWCNARLSVATYYERFGFVRTNKSYKKQDIDFVVMELQLSTESVC